jgi:hypothetical protein
MTTTRTRKRPISVDGGAPKATAAMKAAARAYFAHSKAKNREEAAGNKERKKLLTMMEDAKVTDFSMQTTVDGKHVSLDVSVGAPVRNVIDVERLKDLVDEKTFMKIIGASVAAVTDHAGKVIATQCSVATEGTRNVTVKAAK